VIIPEGSTSRVDYFRVASSNPWLVRQVLSHRLFHVSGFRQLLPRDAAQSAGIRCNEAAIHGQVLAPDQSGFHATVHDFDHRLLAFSFWQPVNTWIFVHANGKKKQTLTFHPYLSINEYAGLATALLAGAGIGDLPPIVQPQLLRAGKLVEVMLKWRFRIFHLWMVHLGNRYIPRPVRVFKDFAAQMAPKLFPIAILSSGLFAA
jgi:LysR substrate binding domain